MRLVDLDEHKTSKKNKALTKLTLKRLYFIAKNSLFVKPKFVLGLSG
jgi:hypothetical protein